MTKCDECGAPGAQRVRRTSVTFLDKLVPEWELRVAMDPAQHNHVPQHGEPNACYYCGLPSSSHEYLYVSGQRARLLTPQEIAARVRALADGGGQ